MNGIWMFSAVLWVFLDRAKKIWARVSWGNWLTISLAAATGLILAFGYKLDLLMAVGLTGELKRVPAMESRLKELDRLGYAKIIVAKGAAGQVVLQHAEVVECRLLQDVMAILTEFYSKMRD